MKHYLCDMENVQDRWANILPQSESGDIVTFFYTDKVSPVPMGVLGPACVRGILFDFAECENGRPNALDFQLVTELGRLSVLEKDVEFIIVSADQGFQSVVKFMKDRDVTVSCFNPGKTKQVCDDGEGDIDSVHMDKTDEALFDTYSGLLKRAGLPNIEACTVAGILMSAMCEPANRRKLTCCNALRMHYGSNEGSVLYRRIKKIVDDVVVNGPFPEPGSKPLSDVDRLSLAFKNDGLNFPDTYIKEVYEALHQALRTRNPKQSLKDRLVKRFGKKPGAAAYQVAVRFL